MTFSAPFGAAAFGSEAVTLTPPEPPDPSGTPRPRLVTRTAPASTGSLVLALARAPRGVRAPSPLFRR